MFKKKKPQDNEDVFDSASEKENFENDSSLEQKQESVYQNYNGENEDVLANQDEVTDEYYAQVIRDVVSDPSSLKQKDLKMLARDIEIAKLQMNDINKTLNKKMCVQYAVALGLGSALSAAAVLLQGGFIKGTVIVLGLAFLGKSFTKNMGYARQQQELDEARDYVQVIEDATEKEIHHRKVGKEIFGDIYDDEDDNESSSQEK